MFSNLSQQSKFSGLTFHPNLMHSEHQKKKSGGRLIGIGTAAELPQPLKTLLKNLNNAGK